MELTGMKLVVFGANGPTGRKVVQQALAAGHEVRAVTRKPDRYPMSVARLTVVEVDVTDGNGVDRAVAGSDAVISTFGVPYGRRKVVVYSEGITNILAAMDRSSVSRLVCVSSTGIASHEVKTETFFWRKLIVPFFRNVLGKTVYDDMERMEAIVRSSQVDWTVIRPAALFNTDRPTVDYKIDRQRIHGRFTSRADLAATLLKEAVDPQHLHEIIEVVSFSGTPSKLRFLIDNFSRQSTEA